MNHKGAKAMELKDYEEIKVIHQKRCGFCGGGGHEESGGVR